MKIRIPKNTIKFGAVGYKFEINFAGCGKFIGEITDIRQDAENNKDRRCTYFEDDDIEDLSLEELRTLKRITPLSLSPIKISHQSNINVHIPTTEIVGNMGFKFKIFFKGHDVFEGQVISIKKYSADSKDRRCLYLDGDKEDLSLNHLIYWNNKYPKHTPSLSTKKTSTIKTDISFINDDLDISTSSHVSSILSESNHEQCLENSISNEDE